MTPATVPKVGVIGAGLIGGSICKALRAAGTQDAVVFSPSRSTISEVEKAGFPTVGSVADIVAACDVLFVCVPLTVQHSVFESIADAVRAIGKNDLIVTDVGSVKGAEAAKATALFASAGVAYVPGHPMAGTEESGFVASTDHMFDGATWVLCPVESDPGSLLDLMQLVIAMKAKVSVLDVESHDRAVAAISHLPHVLAATLVNVLPDSDDRALAIQLAAGSFRDVSRVAGSEPWLSASMVNFNSVQVRRMLGDAVSAMNDLMAALDAGDHEKVLDFFERAHTLRAGYTAAKSSTTTSETVSVPVDRAVAALLEACRQGSLVRAVSREDTQWHLRLER